VTAARLSTRLATVVRRCALGAALLLVGGPGLGAQGTRDTATPARIDTAAGGSGSDSQPTAAVVAPGTTPSTPSATRGLAVPAGSRIDGFVVLRGPVDGYGTVAGDAVVISGDLVVHPGARVTGDAVSVFGQVRTIGSGVIVGDVRSGSDGGASRRAPAVAPAPDAPDTTWHALKLVLGWLTILLVIGFGVLVTASPYLDGVTETMEVGLGRALAIGIAGQMLVLPALLALVVALALTVVGILAIPLGVVAFVLAVAGLVTLGFLAVAFITGRSIAGGDRGPTRRRATSARGEAVRSLSVGLLIYMAPWVAAAALVSVPAAAVVLRTVALATTWVAATAGFGAAIASRAGTRSESQRNAGRGGRTPERDPYVSSAPGWQTPTPVSGVVAARRPTAVPSARD
jgi:hypothetical protein